MTNAVKAATVSTESGDSYVDWREETPQGAGASPTAHQNLDGLAWAGCGHNASAYSPAIASFNPAGETEELWHETIQRQIAKQSPFTVDFVYTGDDLTYYETSFTDLYQMLLWS